MSVFLRSLVGVLAVLLVLVGVFFIQDGRHVTRSHPCDTYDAETLILMDDARQQLDTYLQHEGYSAELRVAEEGSFMLGAYPGSTVLWSIRILEPKVLMDSEKINDILLAAYCFRSGWIWLYVGTEQGEREMLSFSQEDLQIKLEAFIR